MIVSNIKQFFKQNKKIFYYLGFFLVVFSMSFDATFAADGSDKVVGFLVGFLKISVAFLVILNYLIPLFLSPEWYNGTIFDLITHFKSIWILVSNVVYFVFAFILIWIAFMNIIGKTGEQYQLKQALPKFIVGVLIVPFSWFLVQFILSISAILTMSALTLPHDTFKNYDVKVLESPSYCKLNLTSIDLDNKSDTNIDKILSCSDGKSGVENSSNGAETIFSIISTYTYGVLNIGTIDDITKELLNGNKTKTLLDLGIHMIFAVILMVIYFILFIALGLVLFIRGVYLWIYIMMSPLFGLMYFFNKEGGGDGFFSKFNIKEFIALAMVPVYTMLALSFGLLFIYVAGQGLTTMNDGGSIKLTNDGKNLHIGGFELEVEGSLGSMNAESLNSKSAFIMGGVDGGLGAIGTLILKLFGIVVLWGTIMAAMRASEITKAIVEPLHAFGGKVGSIMTSAPGNIPVFGGMSAKGLEQVGTTASSYYSEKSRKTGSDFVDKHSLFGGNVKSVASSATAKDYSQGESAGSEVAMKKLSDAIYDFKQVQDMKSGNGDIIEAIKNNSKALGVEESIYKDLSTKSSPEAIAKAIYALDAKSEISMKGSIIKGDFRGGKHDTETLSSLNGILAEGDKGIDTSIKKRTDNEIQINISDIDHKLRDGLNDEETEGIAIQLTSQGLNGRFTLDEFKTQLKSKGVVKDSDINNIIKYINSQIEIINNGKKDGETKVIFFRDDVK